MNEALALPTPVDEIPPALPPEAAPPTALPVTPFDKLAGALAACTKEIGEHPVIKRGKNAFHGYKYPRIEDVMDVVSDALAKFGLVLQQGEMSRGFLDKGSVVFVQYEFYFMHESGQCSPRIIPVTGQSKTRDSKGGYDDKSIIKCHTQARKAYLMSTFQIKTADEDERWPRKQKQQPEIEQPGAPKHAPPEGPPPGYHVHTPLSPDKPVAIPRDDGPWQDWTRIFLTMINGAPTIDHAEKWWAANLDTLNLLEVELEMHFQFVLREYNKRLRKLLTEYASMKLQFIKGALVPADDEARGIGKKHKIGDEIEIEVISPRHAAFNSKIFVTLDEIAKMLGITMQSLRAEILIETGRAENLKLRDGTRAWALPSMSKSSMTQAELSSFWADAQAYIVKEVLIALDGDQQERVLSLLGVNRDGEPVNILQAG